MDQSKLWRAMLWAFIWIFPHFYPGGIINSFLPYSSLLYMNQEVNEIQLRAPVPPGLVLGYKKTNWLTAMNYGKKCEKTMERKKKTEKRWLIWRREGDAAQNLALSAKIQPWLIGSEPWPRIWLVGSIVINPPLHSQDATGSELINSMQNTKTAWKIQRLHILLSTLPHTLWKVNRSIKAKAT